MNGFTEKVFYLMVTPNKYQKFVILTMQRTGSNMLVSMLNNHPQIACFGELMRKTPDWMLKKGYRGTLKILEVLDEFKDDKVRFAHPYEFVNTAFSTRANKPIKGFKLHVFHHPSFLEKLVHDQEYSMVVLLRDNVLAQYSSEKIAAETGQGSVKKGTKIKHVRVIFNEKEFQKYYQNINRNREKIKSFTANQKNKCFQIEYTKLMYQKKISELISFLGADADAEIKPGTEKRNSSDILSRFVNPDDARKAIEEMGRPEWAWESI